MTLKGVEPGTTPMVTVRRVFNVTHDTVAGPVECIFEKGDFAGFLLYENEHQAVTRWPDKYGDRMFFPPGCLKPAGFWKRMQLFLGRGTH